MKQIQCASMYFLIYDRYDYLRSAINDTHVTSKIQFDGLDHTSRISTILRYSTVFYGRNLDILRRTQVSFFYSQTLVLVFSPGILMKLDISDRNLSNNGVAKPFLDFILSANKISCRLCLFFRLILYLSKSFMLYPYTYINHF